MFHTRVEASEKLGSVSIVISSHITLYASLNRLTLPLTPPTHSDFPPPSLLQPPPPASIYLYAVLPYPVHRSIPPFYHQCHVTCDPVRRSATRHRSIIERVVIYWSMMFWRRRKYVSTSSNHTYTIAAYRCRYLQLSTMSLSFYIPTIRRATLWWNLRRLLLKLGVITQLSDPNKRFAWKNA